MVELKKGDWVWLHEVKRVVRVQDESQCINLNDQIKLGIASKLTPYVSIEDIRVGDRFCFIGHLYDENETRLGIITKVMPYTYIVKYDDGKEFTYSEDVPIAIIPRDKGEEPQKQKEIEDYQEFEIGDYHCLIDDLIGVVKGEIDSVDLRLVTGIDGDQIHCKKGWDFRSDLVRITRIPEGSCIDDDYCIVLESNNIKSGTIISKNLLIGCSGLYGRFGRLPMFVQDILKENCGVRIEEESIPCPYHLLEGVWDYQGEGFYVDWFEKSFVARSIHGTTVIEDWKPGDFWEQKEVANFSGVENIQPKKPYNHWNPTGGFYE